MSTPEPLFDTHCHLQDRKFAGEEAEAVERATERGLVGMLVCGYDAPSIEAAIDMAECYPAVYAGAGVHPHDADGMTPELLARIRELAAHPRCIAIGEIGLDFYRDLSPRDVQLRVLKQQLEIADDVGLPVSVHSREAEEAIYEPLAAHAASFAKRHRGLAPGVMHCFAGSPELALRFVDLGYVISVPCTITYPKNERAREIARSVPLESLVVETDAPYLPPQAIRGKRNEPAFVEAAVRGLAESRNMAFADVARATTGNALRVFRRVHAAQEAVV